MCSKMPPRPNVLVCTYYGGERGEPDEAAGSSRRRERARRDGVAVLFKTKDPTSLVVGNNNYPDEIPNLLFWRVCKYVYDDCR